MSLDSSPALRHLYPAREPYAIDRIKVEGGHELYVEQSGNPNGYPILFVHGGPGGGTSPVQRRFFDPKRFRIILFDQRGCGQSKPHASLENNTTNHLINDMETIRRTLKVDQWAIFGGSWGSTLGLLYAEAFPDRVSHMVLRGVFLMRKQELDWFYKSGTKSLFPDAWERFVAPIPVEEHDDLIAAYYKRLTDPALKMERVKYARAWSVWEGSTVTLSPNEVQRAQSVDPYFADAFARIEAHYFYHGGFLDSDNQILENAHKIAHIPTTIIQGRYDAVCPPISAWELSKALPKSDLRLVPAAGHSAFEPGIQHELIVACDAIVS